MINWSILLVILISVEAPRTEKAAQAAINREGAYGILQIRQLALEDVNNFSATAVQKQWGKNALTLKDCLDPDISMWVCQEYLTYWGKHYTRTTGQPPTYEVMARMWNGGPRGWQKTHLTDRYWSKVEAEFQVHTAHDCMLTTSAIKAVVWKGRGLSQILEK